MNAQRGAALIVTLGIILILLPLGAYVVFQCRTDLLIQRSFREGIEAFYVAEAGLEHAVADLRPGLSFDTLLAGPDGLAGSADDGAFPFSEGIPGTFPSPPFRYNVRVSRRAADSVYLVSEGSGKDGATKTVAAMVSHSPLVWTPAAVYVQGSAEAVEWGAGDFLLSGLDHAIHDAPARPNGAAAPVPGLGSANPDTERALRVSLGEEGAGRCVGAGGPPSIATTVPADVQALASLLVHWPDSLVFGEITPSDPARIGTSQTPQLSVVTGNVDIAGHAAGNGILLVLGNLHVGGELEFTGLVVVMGGVLFDPSSDVVIAGALWHGANGDGQLRLRGRGAVMYSSAALAAIDAAFPGVLPHAAVVTGWLEQL